MHLSLSRLLYGIFFSVCVLTGFAACRSVVFAQDSHEVKNPEYFVGVIERIVEEQKRADGYVIQKVEVRVPATDEREIVEQGSEIEPISPAKRLHVGEKVVVVKQSLYGGGTQLAIADTYRMPILWWLFFGLLAVVFVVGRWRGVSAFVGMLVSLVILVGYILPHILSGDNPLIISMIGALGIGTISLYLSHGFSIKTHISLASLYAVLALVAALTLVSVAVGKFVGLGSEEALFLQFGSTAQINLQGLFMGGVILGALGVLDDIVVSQVAVVFQLKAAQKKIDFAELYARGLFVGKEHVASLVNTLVLAYAGANLPLFLLFMINKSTPIWVVINSETIAEEVIRTLVGSIGLVAAVPLATAIAAIVAIRISVEQLHKVTEVSVHAH